MKHYTSKLSTYSDLGTLETFGFRGEALSSLCALSRFTVTTCLHSDVPKGTKLEFETSGRLKGTSVVAAQKGTTVSVENLFQNLPVRRRELERNIKREWGKVISLLNQYACVQTGLKFTVSQQPNKGKRIVLFSTKCNKTTRENIINVFGAKTMSALVALDLKLELEPTSGPSQRRNVRDGEPTEVLVQGYVSKPVHGEGRQTPDRQMFYVNSRPCSLPQFAKVFNEVYRSFNSSQSPFIFADIRLDTHLYDVNVSPDKRTILLHDQSRMLENLRESLTELFEKQDFTMPVSQITPFKQPQLRRPDVAHQESSPRGPVKSETSGKVLDAEEQGEVESAQASEDTSETDTGHRAQNMAAAKSLARGAQNSDLLSRWIERRHDGQEQPAVTAEESETASRSATKHMETESMVGTSSDRDTVEYVPEATDTNDESISPVKGTNNEDFRARLARMKRSFLPESLRGEMSDSESVDEPPIPSMTKTVKPQENAPLSVSSAKTPKRSSQEVATITIGEHTVTSIIGNPSKRARRDDVESINQSQSSELRKSSRPAAPLPSFGGRLTQMFAAAGTKDQISSVDGLLHTQEEESDDQSQLGDERSSEENSEVAPDDDVSVASSPLFVEQDDEGEGEEDHDVEDEEGNTQEYYEEDERSLEDEASDKNDGNDRREESAEQDVPENQEPAPTAEDAADEPSEENQKRTQTFLKGGTKGKYSTQTLLLRLKVKEEALKRRLEVWRNEIDGYDTPGGRIATDEMDAGLEAENAEQKLALTIHKGDFGKMKIVGQFNLGFVLAVRPRTATSEPSALRISRQESAQQTAGDDELFIIDQHASDEKFNFERLQASTVVQSQRLVRPKHLELTAVEEEIVIENQAALEKNGFIVDVDESGDEPVGSRCRLLALPLSRETTFSLADLEELISLLGDNPTTSSPTGNTTALFPGTEDADSGGSDTRKFDRYVPRPSKVRKMFAMRACRSSIMIGKALSRQQMERVVQHMGEMEKPWNCPHGRPTMRHLCGLGAAWDERGWREGDYDGMPGNWASLDHGSGLEPGVVSAARTTDWAGYLRQMKVDS